MAVSVGQIQDTIGDAGCRAIRVNMVQTHRDLRSGFVRAQAQLKLRSPDNIHLLLQGL